MAAGCCGAADDLTLPSQCRVIADSLGTVGRPSPRLPLGASKARTRPRPSVQLQCCSAAALHLRRVAKSATAARRRVGASDPASVQLHCSSTAAAPSRPSHCSQRVGNDSALTRQAGQGQVVSSAAASRREFAARRRSDGRESRREAAEAARLVDSRRLAPRRPRSQSGRTQRRAGRRRQSRGARLAPRVGARRTESSYSESRNSVTQSRRSATTATHVIPTYCKSSDCSAAAAPQLEAGRRSVAAGVAGLRWSGATWPAAQRRPAPGRRRLGRRRPGDPAPARRRVHCSRVEQGTGPRSPGSPGSRREPPTP